jgi:N-formylglutamate amidohydrolase
MSAHKHRQTVRNDDTNVTEMPQEHQKCIRTAINMRFGYGVVKSDWTRPEPQKHVVTICTARFNGINCTYVLSTTFKTDSSYFLEHHEPDGFSNGSTALSAGY